MKLAGRRMAFTRCGVGGSVVIGSSCSVSWTFDMVVCSGSGFASYLVPKVGSWLGSVKRSMISLDTFEINERGKRDCW